MIEKLVPSEDVVDIVFNDVQSVLSNKYLIRVGGSKLRFYVRWIFHKMQNHIRRRERSFLYRFF